MGPPRQRPLSKRARWVSLAHEHRQGYGDGAATNPAHAMNKLLRLGNLRVELVALAAHCFSLTREVRSWHWAVPAPGDLRVLACGWFGANQLMTLTWPGSSSSAPAARHRQGRAARAGAKGARQDPALMRLQGRSPEHLPNLKLMVNIGARALFAH